MFMSYLLLILGNILVQYIGTQAIHKYHYILVIGLMVPIQYPWEPRICSPSIFIYHQILMEVVLIL